MTQPRFEQAPQQHTKEQGEDVFVYPSGLHDMPTQPTGQHDDLETTPDKRKKSWKNRVIAGVAGVATAAGVIGGGMLYAKSDHNKIQGTPEAVPSAGAAPVPGQPTETSPTSTEIAPSLTEVKEGLARGEMITFDEQGNVDMQTDKEFAEKLVPGKELSPEQAANAYIENTLQAAIHIGTDARLEPMFTSIQKNVSTYARGHVIGVLEEAGITGKVNDGRQPVDQNIGEWAADINKELVSASKTNPREDKIDVTDSFDQLAQSIQGNVYSTAFVSKLDETLSSTVNSRTTKYSVNITVEQTNRDTDPAWKNATVRMAKVNK
ncbi:MAG TPA: hypothetical protein VK502_00150 [Candidatus Saccharimonadales bacterium]|nr:hypothetical protein [Candidatus Saccharimonadales bacterium]